MPKSVGILLASIAIWTTAAPAEAAFPGTNGKIAFSTFSSVDVMNADGSARSSLFSSNPPNNEHPAWSPDGQKIAFRTDRGGGISLIYDIYVMNADGSNPTNITNTAAAEDSPAWSADGQKIVFDSGTGIYVMNADGTGRTLLTPEAGNRPAWSPDGTKIAYSCPPVGGICVINPDGTGRTELTSGGPGGDYPDWSPDGSRIAFESNRDGNGEIYVMNADGSEQTRLTNHPGEDGDPAWSPDGQRIAFSANRDAGNPEVYVMNADGSSPINLTSRAGFDGEPDWQPRPGYPRPKGATPLYASLVPAYLSCAAPDRQHGSSLAFASCSPPTALSSYLTVGTPDSNGQPAKSSAWLRIDARPGDPLTMADEADAALSVSVSDVRNRSDLADYTGELEAVLTPRITDKSSGMPPEQPATVTDLVLPFAVPCTATADASLGSACALSTTIEAVLPNAIAEGQRTIWALGQIQARDGGDDGLASTATDNTLFLKQGVFVP